MTEGAQDAGTQKKGLPAAVQTMLRKMSSDMKLLGILQIIGGAIYCLTIIGAIAGVPYIFAGIRLKNAGEAFNAYAGTADAARLKNALEEQARFFWIIKILVLVTLGLVALSLVLMILFSMFAAMQMSQ